MSIESTWSKQGFIKNLWDISGSEDNNTAISFETIHFSKKLVNSLFSFIITHTHTLVSLSTDGIKLINEDNTWSILFGFSEKISYS